jgi:molecular chaperone GrpE (heat shock protein)
MLARQQKGRALRAAQAKVFSRIAHVQRGITDLRRRGKADVLAVQVAANRAFAEDLLAVADSLEAAVSNSEKMMVQQRGTQSLREPARAGQGVEEGEQETEEGAEALRATFEGIQGVHAVLIKSFECQGVTPMVVSLDDVFDPSLHSASPTDPGNPEQPHTPTSEVRKVSGVVKPGYMFKGETLRHAHVTLTSAGEAHA